LSGPLRGGGPDNDARSGLKVVVSTARTRIPTRPPVRSQLLAELYRAEHGLMRSMPSLK